MRFKTIIFTALGVFLSSFVLTALSWAGGKGKAQNTFLEAEFTPGLTSPEPEAEGESDYREQMHKGAVKQERFELKVKIPVPSTGLGISDEASAQAADVRVTLSRAGVAYAECFLEPTGIESEFEDGLTETQALYKADVRRKLQKGATYRQQDVHGSCDTDLVTDGVQLGVPAVEANDTATVTLSGITAFLDGVFAED